MKVYVSTFGESTHFVENVFFFSSGFLMEVVEVGILIEMVVLGEDQLLQEVETDSLLDISGDTEIF